MVRATSSCNAFAIATFSSPQNSVATMCDILYFVPEQIISNLAPDYYFCHFLWFIPLRFESVDVDFMYVRWSLEVTAN